MGSSTTHAYIAGYLDGEGCISLIPPLSSRTLGAVGVATPTVEVSATDRAAIHLCNQTFGGAIHDKASVKNNGRRAWVWRCSGGLRVEPALVAVVPYMTIKRPQAEAVLRFIREKGPRPAVGARLSNEEVARRGALAEAVSALKRASVHTLEGYTAPPVAELSAYLAGYIDAEGSVQLQRHESWGGTPVISVTSTDKCSLELLKLTFGGRIDGPVFGTAKHKPRWSWRAISRRQVEPLLTSILPYLLIKKEQARLTLDFIEGMPPTKVRRVPGHHGGFTALPEVELQRRRGLVAQVAALKATVV